MASQEMLDGHAQIWNTEIHLISFTVFQGSHNPPDTTPAVDGH